MSNSTIFFVGRFKLPDGTAAAQLIKGIAKIFKQAGCRVIIIDKEVSKNTEHKNVVHIKENDYEAYKILYPNTARGKIESYMEEKTTIELVEKEEKSDFLAYYNYPAVGIRKIQNFARKNKIVLIPIVTEWYSTKGRSLPIKIFKGIDIAVRMRILHKKEKAMIVSSTFLENYYKKNHMLRIPAVVDSPNLKWAGDSRQYEQEQINLVYAGSPGKNKDKIDVIINLLAGIDKKAKFKLRVVGITKQEYERDYSQKCTDERIEFLGRVSHEECVCIICASDFTMLYRKPDRVATAGFPTKISESIACGIPAITTDTSDIGLYIKDDKNGFILPIEEDAAREKLKMILQLSRSRINEMKEYTKTYQPFDYENYVPITKNFINAIEKEVL